MKTFLEMLRVKQWYKSFLIFLPIIFVGHLFVWKELLLTLIGFFSLSFVSSAGYIINDLHDIKKDRKHPEKKLRPIAAGKIKSSYAVITSILLFVVGIFSAYFLSLWFMISLVGIFFITLLYTFLLRNIVFADILAIAINFVIRAASGAFIISVVVSPWLILCTFFLSLFLSTGKRASDLKLLENKAVSYRSTLKSYTPQITGNLLTIAITALVMSYTLFSFMGIHKYLIFSLPFALYVMFYYLGLINSGSEIARRPEIAFRDRKLLLGIVLWIISVVLLIYV